MKKNTTEVASRLPVPLLAGCALVLGALGCSGGADSAAGSGGEEAAKAQARLSSNGVSIDWSMPDMFGNDFDGDGLLELSPIAPSDPARSPVLGPPMRPSAWKVLLDGCGSTPAVSYTWDFTLPNEVKHIEAGASCSTWTEFPQGSHDVTLTLAFPDGSTTSGSQRITVKNYLIVSMGDSIASGEGAPDVPAVWTGLGWRRGISAEARWVDKRCHRSANSGHAQAALALEHSDKHSSVRFVSFACSGATIQDLIEPGYMGIAPDAGAAPLPAQIQAAKATLCPLRGSPPGSSPPPCAPIDALLLTVGANDLRFGDIVKDCANPNPFTDCRDGDVMVSGMQASTELPARYDSLDQAIRQQLDVKQVYFAEYDDPTHDDSGNLCSELRFTDAVADQWVQTLGPIIPAPPIDGVINNDELVWARDHILKPLNSIALASSQRRDWKFIGGIADAFGSHGYCAGDRWIDTYSDSKVVERVPEGTMHPNAAGYAAIARSILPSLEEDTTLPRSLVSSAPPPASAENHVLSRGTDDAIYTQHWDGSAWEGWSPLGGNMSSIPVALATAWNRAFVFATDKDGILQKNRWSLWWNGWESSTQRSWSSDAESVRTDLRLVGTPVAVGTERGVDVFARGDDGELWHLSLTADGANWGSAAWEPTHAPRFVGTPSAVATGPNRFDVIVRGEDQALWHGYENRAGDVAGDWQWHSLGGVILGSPKLVSWDSSRLDLFAVGTDHALYHHWYQGGWGWGDWESLGLEVASDPEVVSSAPGKFDIFVRGPAQNVWRRKFDSAGWGEWQSLGLPTQSGIAADTRGPDSLDLFAVWPDGGVFGEALEANAEPSWSWLGGAVR